MAKLGRLPENPPPKKNKSSPSNIEIHCEPAPQHIIDGQTEAMARLALVYFKSKKADGQRITASGKVG